MCVAILLMPVTAIADNANMVLGGVLQMMQQHNDVEEVQEFGCQVLDGIAMYCQG